MNRRDIAAITLTLLAVAAFLWTATLPNLEAQAEELIAVGAIYLFVVATSGYVVRTALWFAGATDIEEEVDTGRAVGKVENVLILTLVLVDAFTALGLVFTAKSIVRYQDMSSGNTTYYLTGSVTNFTYTLFVGVLTTRFIPLV